MELPVPNILPPKGVQDAARLDSLPGSDREYMEFCLDFCRGILESRPYHFEALAMAANCLTGLGFYADGLKVDEILASLSPDDPAILYNLACSQALNANRDAAFNTLSLAIDNGYSDHSHIRFDKDLANLRDDPRFAELLEKAFVREAFHPDGDDCPE